MAGAQSEVACMSVCEQMEELSIDGPGAPKETVTEFVYENPVAWHANFKIDKNQLTQDVLFNNIDMKNITLAQYGSDKPEHIKWKLFGYNLVICYEYISKWQLDLALKTIEDMEDILVSVGRDDTFLKSIKIALNHITFSMKDHVLALCSFESKVNKSVIPELNLKNFEHFVMPTSMNNVNKAAIFGVQSLFFYEYGLPCIFISKDAAYKAISLNEKEAEWHYLVARVFTFWQRSCGNYFECSEQEIKSAEMAVHLSKKDHHKLHLVHIYHRMSKNLKKNEELKIKILDIGLKLIKEVMNNTNNLLSLKNCLLSLSKIALDRVGNNDNISDLLEKLVLVLESSNNGYVHGAIGNYYLFNKKDYEKANFHLKKAYDSKSFGCSIDYIYTFFKISPVTAPVEQMLLDMLDTFSHPVHQEKILSQIVSYLIYTKNNLIQALKYISLLLSLKNVTCVYSLQTHRIKFTSQQHKSVNLLDVISEKLDAASKDQRLSVDHKKKVDEVICILESYKLYVINLMKEKKLISGNNFRKDSSATNYVKNNEIKNESEKFWTFKNPKHDMNNTKKEKENWRTLKPDLKSNSSIFSQGYQKYTSRNGIEIKSRFNRFK